MNTEKQYGSIIFTKLSQLKEYYVYAKARGNKYRVCLVSNYITDNHNTILDGSSLLCPEPSFRYFNDGEMKKYRNSYLNYLQIDKVNGLVGYLVRMAYEGKDVIIVTHDKEMQFEILDILKEFMTEMYKIHGFTMKSYVHAVENELPLSSITEESLKSMEKFVLNTTNFVVGFLNEQQAMKEAYKQQKKEEKKARKKEKKRLKKAKKNIEKQLDNFDDNDESFVDLEEDDNLPELIMKYKDDPIFEELDDIDIQLLAKGIDIVEAIKFRNRKRQEQEKGRKNKSYGVETCGHNRNLKEKNMAKTTTYTRTKTVTDNPLIGISEEECHALYHLISDALYDGKRAFKELAHNDTRVYDMLLVDEELAEKYELIFNKSPKKAWLKFYSDKFHVSEITDDEDYAEELRNTYNYINEEVMEEDNLSLIQYFGQIENMDDEDDEDEEEVQPRKIYRPELKKQNKKNKVSKKSVKKHLPEYKGGSDDDLLDGDNLMRPIFVNGRFFAPDTKAGQMREYDMDGYPMYTLAEIQKVFMQNQLRGESRKAVYTHEDFVESLENFEDIFVNENRKIFHEEMQKLFNEYHEGFNPSKRKKYIHAIQDIMDVVWDKYGDDTNNIELFKTLTPNMLCQLGLILHPSQGNPYRDDDDDFENEFIEDERYYRHKYLYINGKMTYKYLATELETLENLEKFASDLGLLNDNEYFDNAEDAIEYIMSEVDEDVLNKYFHVRLRKHGRKYVEFTDYPLDDNLVEFVEEDTPHRRRDYDDDYDYDHDRYATRVYDNGLVVKTIREDGTDYDPNEDYYNDYDDDYEGNQHGDTFTDDDGQTYWYNAQSKTWFPVKADS